MKILSDSPRVRESLTWKLTQFSIGRRLLAEEASIVAEIHQAAAEQGGSYQATIAAIVQSELVQKMKAESEQGDRHAN